jgi:hypothetical protein
MSMTPPTSLEGPIELFTARFQAVAPGIASVAADPADEPINETTVFNRNTALLVRELRLGFSELVINPSGEAFTSAIDDAYPNGIDSNGAPIRAGSVAKFEVLANDLLGPTNQVSEFQVVRAPAFGTAIVSNGLIQYTPDGGVVNKYDSFTYQIVTADGVRSTAEVSLFVGDPQAAQDNAPAGNKPFDVDVKLRVVDGNGNPVNRVAVGSRFGVQVIVQDLRSTLAANPLGVYAAFSDILYNANLAKPSNIIPNDPFNFDVIFAAPFGIVGASGVADRLGIIDELGSFLTDTNQPVGPNFSNQPVLMATLYFDAVKSGSLQFASSPADSSPYHDTLLFQPPAPVPVQRIRYNVASVTIGSGASGESAFRQNAILPTDVNGDGFVTPIDALLIINQVSRFGREGETVATGQAWFSDVNNDEQVNPQDALLVINHLGAARNGGVPTDVKQISKLTPSSNGLIPIDSPEKLKEVMNRRFQGGGASGEGESSLRMVPYIAGLDSEDDSEEETWMDLLADDISGFWKL